MSASPLAEHEEVVAYRERPPFAVYQTKEDQQRAFEAMLGERLAKLQRALRRAERERDELREEVEELRRELHTGGTPLE